MGGRENVFMREECKLLWLEGEVWQIFLIIDGHHNILHVTQCDFDTSPIELYLCSNPGGFVIMAEVLLCAFSG